MRPEPSAFVVGMSQETVAEPSWIACTSRSKGASEAESLPSETEIVTPGLVPISVAPGVPVRLPVAVSKLAHDGGLSIENVRVSPSASLAVGVKEYGCPSVTCKRGEPLMTGARFDGVGVTFVDVSDPPPPQPAAARMINVQIEIRISVPKPIA